MNFKKIIFALTEYWKSQGLDLLYSYDVEKGAGTASPHTFLRVLDNVNEGFFYIEPCRRPQDGRYGINPNRVYQHHQFQVIIKPAPVEIEDIYLKSLEYIGVNLEKNDIRFLEDNWKQPTLGAWGLGSEVRMNGNEITQFTYFQQVGSIDLPIVPVEIAYGLERLALAIQSKNDIMDIDWDGEKKYGDVFRKREQQFSKYSFEVSKKENYFQLFDIYLEEGQLAIDAKLAMPAYDFVLKASHVFNILDAKKLIAPEDKQGYILKVSKLAKMCCKTYMEDK